MPEINQYFLSHQELVEAILKHSDIHEGRWVLLVNFGFAAANIGTETGPVLPSGVASIQKVGIQRADESSPPGLVVDAAQVNPAPKPKKPAKRAKSESS